LHEVVERMRIQNFWQQRLDHIKQALESNNFEVYNAANPGEAKRIVLEEILPATRSKHISWGGSKTVLDVGLIQRSRRIRLWFS
jgi:hypothetical protein